MKGLLTLIRLKRRELDQVRRALAQKNQEKEQVLASMDLLQRNLEKEQKLAANMPEMHMYLTGFAAYVGKRQEELRFVIKVIDKEIHALMEEIAARFRELKPYEIVRDRKIEQAKKELTRKEQQMFDDIAVTRYAEMQRHIPED